MEKTLTIKERYAELMKLNMTLPTCRKIMEQKREQTARQNLETQALIKQVLTDKARGNGVVLEAFKVDENSTVSEQKQFDTWMYMKQHEHHVSMDVVEMIKQRRREQKLNDIMAYKEDAF